MVRIALKAGLVLLAGMTIAACSDGAAETVAPHQADIAVMGAAQASVPGSPGDLAAMQGIVDALNQHWTAGNPGDYAALYANAEWVGPNGNVLNNAAAIAGTYTFLLTVALPGTTRQSTIRNVTFLTGTIAVLDIDARVTGFAAPPPGLVPWQAGILRAFERNVLVKRGNVWTIIKHQQTFVAPGIP